MKMSSAFSLKQGRFARLSQTTLLLSQALRHAASPAPNPILYDEESAQLRRTLFALIQVSHTEAHLRQLEFCAQSAVTYSTILLLQERRWRRDNDDSTPLSAEMVQQISPETTSVITELTELVTRLLDNCMRDSILSCKLSPFLVRVMYQACAILTRLNWTTNDPVRTQTISQFKELLGRFDLQLRSAGMLQPSGDCIIQGYILTNST